MRQVPTLIVIGLMMLAPLVWIVAETAPPPPLSMSRDIAVVAELGPNTLEEAFQILNRNLPSHERSWFKRTPEKQAAIEAHFGLGLWIRNAWIHSGRSRLPEYFRSLGIQHPDDMSSMVLVSYWRYLNGKPIEIEKQAACYRRWWEEQDRLSATRKDKSSHASPDFDCP